MIPLSLFSLGGSHVATVLSSAAADVIAWGAKLYLRAYDHPSGAEHSYIETVAHIPTRQVPDPVPSNTTVVNDPAPDAATGAAPSA